jgi:hypothetical protein
MQLGDVLYRAAPGTVKNSTSAFATKSVFFHLGCTCAFGLRQVAAAFLEASLPAASGCAEGMFH